MEPSQLKPGSHYIIDSNTDKDKGNNFSKPKFKGLNTIIEFANSGYSICNKPGKYDNRYSGCYCKNNWQIKPA